MVKLLIQPQDGIAPLVSAIKKAKKSIDVSIFRFDRAEIEAALKAAVRRGVSVSALIAYANRGGEKHLRKLEMRLLDAGVNVSRTADKLVRYHNKMMIVDRRTLFVLSFNFTHLDIDQTRVRRAEPQTKNSPQSGEAVRRPPRHALVAVARPLPPRHRSQPRLRRRDPETKNCPGSGEAVRRRQRPQVVQGRTLDVHRQSGQRAQGACRLHPQGEEGAADLR